MAFEHRQVHLARGQQQLGHAGLGRVPHRQAQGHAVAQLPELEGGRVPGGGFVLDRVAQIDQRLQQPVHVALAQLEHDGQLAHSQRALTARQCFHHL